MTTSRSREMETEKSERRSGPFRPREMEKYPERLKYKEISQSRQMEARFREKTESRRVLGLPRVEGFDKSGVTSNQEVREYLKKEFPERHVNNITMESVRYNDRLIKENGHVELAHWEKRELVRGTKVFNKEIVVNRQTPDGNIDKGTIKRDIAHEVGHQVHNMYLERGAQIKWLEISGDRPREKCVSDYACTNPGEDFAESYMTYVRDPESLKTASAEKYNYMRDRVFAGREYDH